VVGTSQSELYSSIYTYIFIIIVIYCFELTPSPSIPPRHPATAINHCHCHPPTATNHCHQQPLLLPPIHCHPATTTATATATSHPPSAMSFPVSGPRKPWPHALRHSRLLRTTPTSLIITGRGRGSRLTRRGCVGGSGYLCYWVKEWQWLPDSVWDGRGVMWGAF
jgi:hypothetical protein